MSVRINLSDLTVQDRTKISKSLRFDKRETSFNKYKPSLQYTHMISKMKVLNKCLQMLNKSSGSDGLDLMDLDLMDLMVLFNLDIYIYLFGGIEKYTICNKTCKICIC